MSPQLMLKIRTRVINVKTRGVSKYIEVQHMATQIKYPQLLELMFVLANSTNICPGSYYGRSHSNLRYQTVT
jgi:hypothetical protein